MALIDQIKAHRSLAINIGDIVFFATRPTVEQFYQAHEDDLSYLDAARQFITGWEGIRTSHFIPDAGGSDELVEFDPVLLNELIADNTGLGAEAGEQILKAALEYITKVESLKKK